MTDLLSHCLLRLSLSLIVSLLGEGEACNLHLLMAVEEVTGTDLRVEELLVANSFIIASSCSFICFLSLIFDYGLQFQGNHLFQKSYVHAIDGCLTPQADRTLYRFLLSYYFCYFRSISCLSLYFYSIALLFSRKSRSLTSLTTEGSGYFLVGLQLLIPPLISSIFSFYFYFYFYSQIGSTIQLDFGNIFFNPFKSLGLYLIVFKS